MVDILMATYNGADYIKQQIDSILRQTCQEFYLIIRDDGSSDNTIDILETYASHYPDKIYLLKDQKGNLGVRRNFQQMLQYSLYTTKGQYIMLCDQDDIWLPEKIEKTMQKIKQIEKKADQKDIGKKPVPSLVFTDLMLIDEEGQIISNSMWEYAGVNPKATALNKLIHNNVITGCTVMINRKLAELTSSIPAGCDMHDYWIALVASSFGRIDYINESLIQYRQHTKNQIGSIRKPTVLERVKKVTVFPVYIRSWQDEYFIRRKQAYLLAKQYKKYYNKADRQMLVNYINLPNMTRLRRLRVLIYFKYWPDGGFMGKMRLILAMFTINSDKKIFQRGKNI